MTKYIVRVELHGASSVDYESLHAMMIANGLQRHITGVTPDNQTANWQLPTGVYVIDSSLGAKEIRELVETVVNTIGFVVWSPGLAGVRTFELIVATTPAAWNGLRSL